MGGTIAGVADASAPRGYRAGDVPIAALASGLGLPTGCTLETEQVAQVDSKDMDEALWLALARRAEHWLGQADVCGLVVTHGTDTLEETAFFLHAVLDPVKPLVVTGAMRPSTDPRADGPGNLRDAIVVAAHADAHGVLVVFAGQVFAGDEVRKVHPHRVDAFAAGDAGPLASIDGDGVRAVRPWPSGGSPRSPDALDALARRLDSGGRLPWVAWLVSHAGSTGGEVVALVAAGVDGLVVGGTGNSMPHHRMEDALRQARSAGVRVLVGSRCSLGDADAPGLPGDTAAGAALQPAKARIALQLQLLLAEASGGATGKAGLTSSTGPAAPGR